MESRGRVILLSASVAVLWGSAQTRSRAEPAAAPPRPLAVHALPLPGAPPAGPVFMDYLAYDRTHHRVWVPAGNTGSVDVIDVTNGTVARVAGFATTEVERRGSKHLVGPSSGTVGDGVVYIGNRGDSSVCAVGAESLRVG